MQGDEIFMLTEGSDEARRVFPERISEAALPQVDRLAHRVHAEYAGTISAQVRLCLKPDGATDYVNLLASSGMVPYDLAVVDTLSSWRYTPYQAPADTRVCEDLTVTYHAH